ncbi:DUF438 domain-containing protein [Candidatus Sumerlaeota bacterium]|nr:DUF438 domain-containing protein [Candidatus Sumerlaeota bacterium]
MNTSDKLVDIIRRLESGEDREEVKEEARQFLASVDPQELAAVEEKLVEAGLSPGDFRH